MKKKLMALFATLAVACLVLVGCGGGGASADDKAAFVGTWEIAGMVENGEEMTADDLKMLKDLGMDVTLTLTEDGKGTLDLFGEAMEGTWEATGAGKANITIEGDTQEMLISGDSLTMEAEGSKLTFTKSGAAAAATDGAASAEASSAEATSAEAAE